MLEKVKGIYVITDGVLWPDRSHVDIAVSAIEGGATVVQLRAKDLETDGWIDTAKLVRKITSAAHAAFIVNDRVDIACDVRADGVHIGPNDMTPADARKMIGPDCILGVSVANVDEARAAAPYASYFGVGPVFSTSTKADAGDAIGLDPLVSIQAEFPRIPVVAIGGINKGNLLAVRDTGVDAAAVVSAVVAADDMLEATKELVALWDS